LKAFDNVDPPPRRQKAITPCLLRRLFQLSHRRIVRANEYDHAADIIIGAFFFAMRSCEYTLTPTPGKTKRVTLGSLLFRDILGLLRPADTRMAGYFIALHRLLRLQKPLQAVQASFEWQEYKFASKDKKFKKLP
jgi:hypothetical protein